MTLPILILCRQFVSSDVNRINGGHWTSWRAQSDVDVPRSTQCPRAVVSCSFLHLFLFLLLFRRRIGCPVKEVPLAGQLYCQTKRRIEVGILTLDCSSILRQFLRLLLRLKCERGKDAYTGR